MIEPQAGADVRWRPLPIAKSPEQVEAAFDLFIDEWRAENLIREYFGKPPLSIGEFADLAVQAWNHVATWSPHGPAQ